MEKRAGKLMEDCEMIADGAKGAVVCVGACVCACVSRHVKEVKRQARVGTIGPKRIVCLHTQNSHISLKICSSRKQMVIYMLTNN